MNARDVIVLHPGIGPMSLAKMLEKWARGRVQTETKRSFTCQQGLGYISGFRRVPKGWYIHLHFSFPKSVIIWHFAVVTRYGGRDPTVLRYLELTCTLVVQHTTGTMVVL